MPSAALPTRPPPACLPKPVVVILGRFTHPARRLTLEEGASAFLDGLRAIEDGARNLGGIRAVSVCLSKRDAQDHRRSALRSLLEQLHASARADARHHYLLFDARRRRMAAGVCDRFPAPAPHRHCATGDERTTTVDCVSPLIGDPYFRPYREDDLLLAANLVAHARLLREEEPSPEALSLDLHRSFYVLDHAVGGRTRVGRSPEATRR